MEEIELHPAYFWDCPKCGTENFSRVIITETQQETGSDRLDTVVMIPQVITCDFCNAKFSTNPENAL